MIALHNEQTQQYETIFTEGSFAQSRRTTGGTVASKSAMDTGLRWQGDAANDTIAAVFNMPGAQRLKPTLSGMSGLSNNSNTFSERYRRFCLSSLTDCDNIEWWAVNCLILVSLEGAETHLDKS